MSEIALFCTCAENNQDKYVNRVLGWRGRLDFLKDLVDFYTVVDGELTSENKDRLRNLTVLEIRPALGRKNLNQFCGWKRSYGTMLSYLTQRYKYITHIENDVLIRNQDKLLEYLTKPGLYSGWCHRFNFIEAAFQILNDAEAVNRLGAKFTDPRWYNGRECFETELGKEPFQYPFSCMRLEGVKEKPGLDFVAQAFGASTL